MVPIVYKELRRSAQRCMNRERPGHSLQATALVNEVYLRLVHIQGISWQDRAHLHAISARMMRRILTDLARSRHYLKRGGEVRHVTFEEGLLVSPEPTAGIVALNDALGQLAALDPRKSQVVELRFFGGLSVDETAEVLKVSPETVMRDWKFSKVWLLRALSGEQSDGR